VSLSFLVLIVRWDADVFFATCRQNVSRRYTYPLKAGHRIAVMCAETTEYRYLERLNAPKKWFQSNVDSVMNIYGMQHHIQKEDLFLGVYLPLLRLFLCLEGVNYHCSRRNAPRAKLRLVR